MISDPDLVGLLYLVTIVCFVVALKFLSSPKHARKGNGVGGAGMLVAVVTTLLLEGIENWALIVAGLVIGTVVGVSTAVRTGVTGAGIAVGRAAPLIRLAVDASRRGPRAELAAMTLRDELVGLMRDTAEGCWRGLRRGVDEFDARTRPAETTVTKSVRRRHRVKR